MREQKEEGLILGDKDIEAKEKASKRYTSEFSDDLILTRP